MTFVNIICNPSIKHTEQSSHSSFFPQGNHFSASLQNSTCDFLLHRNRLSEITPQTLGHTRKKNVYFFPTGAVKEPPTGNRFLKQCPSEWAKTPVFSIPFMSLGKNANRTAVTYNLVCLTLLFRAQSSTSLTWGHLRFPLQLLLHSSAEPHNMPQGAETKNTKLRFSVAAARRYVRRPIHLCPGW